MEDYQKRVLKEEKVLAVNVQCLDDFTMADEYLELDLEEQGRLLMQLSAMNIYLYALGKRIENFK